MSDLIDRQAAIDAIKACDDGHGFVWLDGVRAVLTLLPSVQERKGHDTGESRWFHCSECGYGVFDVYLDDEQKYDLAYHYCPNCGAHMEGAEDAGRNE